MADKPRRTGTIRPVRTRRGIRQKAGLPEKPESASKRLRTRANVSETADPRLPGSTTSGDARRMAGDPEEPQGAQEITLPASAPAEGTSPARRQPSRSRGRSAGRKAQAPTAPEAEEGKAGSEPSAPPLRAEAKRKTGLAKAHTSGNQAPVASSGEAPGPTPQAPAIIPR